MKHWATIHDAGAGAKRHKTVGEGMRAHGLHKKSACPLLVANTVDSGFYTVTQVIPRRSPAPVRSTREKLQNTSCSRSGCGVVPFDSVRVTILEELISLK